MTADAQTPTSEAATQSFEADVSRLLHLMVHSVYSDREIFVRELVSNAADACEKLRYESIAKPELIEDGAPFAIEITINPDAKTVTFSDNGVGMTREDLTNGLGTIARSGTKAFLDKLAAEDASKEASIAHRSIRHRLLFVVHGGGRSHRRHTSRRDERSLALDVGRQGLLHHRRRCRSKTRRSAAPASPCISTTRRRNSCSRGRSSASCATIPARSPCRSTSSRNSAPEKRRIARRRRDLGQVQVGCD